MSRTACIILAAGQGTRMKSDRPKVLHSVMGKPMIAHVVETAIRLKASPIVVVVGHGRAEVTAALAARYGQAVSFVVQETQGGTAHAVERALPALRGFPGDVLILSGDVPLVDASDLKALAALKRRSRSRIVFLSMTLDDPGAYGRVLRDPDGRVVAIREARDCSLGERWIQEVNSGVYLVDAAFLKRRLGTVRKDNAKKERYLTDLVALAAREGRAAAVEGDPDDLLGVNDRIDLAMVEDILRSRILARLMARGVTIRQPSSVHIEADVRIGRDAEIGAGAVISGDTSIGSGSVIGTGSLIVDSRIARGAEVRPYSILEGAVLEDGVTVGPFARIRPGTVLRKGSRVGNFVECKNTVLGQGSKANHLSYLGDGVIGRGVNVGAGTIFCNYDGFSKHTTVLEDGVFIGSDTQIVAPVTIGRGSYVGTGTTITRDVPPDCVALSRTAQENREGCASRLRVHLSGARAKPRAR